MRVGESKCASEAISGGEEPPPERPTKRFVPPTDPDAELHGAKIGLPPNEVAKFCAYYRSNGWRVGRNPMKSWQHAMTGWRTRWEERRIGPRGQHRNDHMAGMSAEEMGKAITELIASEANDPTTY